MLRESCCVALMCAVAGWPAALMGASPAPGRATLETRPAGELARAQIGVAVAAHDFGTVWAGEPLQHAFTIANGGQAPLEITRVVSSCGCTSVGEHPKRIEPGQTGQFAFTMDSRKLRGKFSKTVSIHSNDPRTPILKLTLSGECRHPIEVTPASALFGKVTATQPVSKQITIKNNTEVPLKLL